MPGCNMAFRKAALEEIGGFDERFRVAGDDVDVCWRLQESGWTLGFSAGAVVMHRRRDSVRRYLKQQYGYGKAEALLERKWPSRYNRAGSSRWSGRIYDSLAHGLRPAAGDGPLRDLGQRPLPVDLRAGAGRRSRASCSRRSSSSLIAALGVLSVLGAALGAAAVRPAALRRCARARPLGRAFERRLARPPSRAGPLLAARPCMRRAS